MYPVDNAGRIAFRFTGLGEAEGEAIEGISDLNEGFSDSSLSSSALSSASLALGGIVTLVGEGGCLLLRFSPLGGDFRVFEGPCAALRCLAVGML